jgi:hypothetical protein
MVIHPCRKTLTKRSCVAGRGWPLGQLLVGSSSTVLTGIVSSAIPPTLSNHKVATATANHNRAARCGLVMRVCGHCHPPRLVIVKPGSIPVRSPYQQAVPALGAKSVSKTHGSA